MEKLPLDSVPTKQWFIAAVLLAIACFYSVEAMLAGSLIGLAAALFAFALVVVSLSPGENLGKRLSAAPPAARVLFGAAAACIVGAYFRGLFLRAGG